VPWPNRPDGDARLPAPLPALHAILDVDTAAAAGWRPDHLARAFLDGGAELIQVRAKTARTGALTAVVDVVVEVAQAYNAVVVVNDRADVARMSDAHGVHVGQEDLPVRPARSVVGAGALVGCSTHSWEQLEAALEEPVSYVAVGPVFSTRSKETGYQPLGLSFVERAAKRAAPIPVVAIGGISLDTAGAVKRAGAASVAVIGDLLLGDPTDRVRAFQRALSL